MTTTAQPMNGTTIGRNVERNWRGQAWSNATPASITDPDARLYRKGKPVQLPYMSHALNENRHGFVVEACLTHALRSTFFSGLLTSGLMFQLWEAVEVHDLPPHEPRNGIGGLLWRCIPQYESCPMAHAPFDENTVIVK